MPSKVTVASPAFARLVVTMITPFAPREPYRAFDAASLRTLIDSMSAALMLLMSPS